MTGDINASGCVRGSAGVIGGMPKSEVTEVGVIAQEVEAVAPDLAQTRRVKLQPSDTKKTKIKAVNYSRFTFMLINAVKELYADWLKDHQAIEELKASHEILKTENDRIKQRADQVERDNAELKLQRETIEKTIEKKLGTL